jgi:hypothetical protein
MQDLHCILPLSQEEAPILSPDLQTKEVMHQRKVFHLKLNCKISLAICYQLLVPYQKHVIYVQYQCERFLPCKKIQVRVCLASLETHLYQEDVNPRVPSPRCLLEPIQGSPQSTNMCLCVTNLKSLWLLNIYFLLNNSIQE